MYNPRPLVDFPSVLLLPGGPPVPRFNRGAARGRSLRILVEPLALGLLVDEALAGLEQVAERDDADEPAGVVGRDDGQPLDARPGHPLGRVAARFVGVGGHDRRGRSGRRR